MALARSLVRDPDVFLLDEPLSNLDAQLRAQMRAELKELQRRVGNALYQGRSAEQVAQELDTATRSLFARAER